MKGYILRWNPTISSWTYDRHKNLMKDFEDEETVGMNWSIYDFENLEEGDFFILQQVGTEADGIAMVGTFSSDPYTEASWKKKDGTNLFYADMNVDFMINRKSILPEEGKKNMSVLSADSLSEIFPEIDWHKGHSGVLIPEDKLEPLVLEICSWIFRWNTPNDTISFYSKKDLWQKACDYINAFCPEMRKRIITESADRMIYENYSKGETIDEDLLDITVEPVILKTGLPGELTHPEHFPRFLVPRA